PPPVGEKRGYVRDDRRVSVLDRSLRGGEQIAQPDRALPRGRRRRRLDRPLHDLQLLDRRRAPAGNAREPRHVHHARIDVVGLAGQGTREDPVGEGLLDVLREVRVAQRVLDQPEGAAEAEPRTLRIAEGDNLGVAQPLSGLARERCKVRFPALEQSVHIATEAARRHAATAREEQQQHRHGGASETMTRSGEHEHDRSCLWWWTHWYPQDQRKDPEERLLYSLEPVRRVGESTRVDGAPGSALSASRSVPLLLDFFRDRPQVATPHSAGIAQEVLPLFRPLREISPGRQCSLLGVTCPTGGNQIALGAVPSF